MHRVDVSRTWRGARLARAAALGLALFAAACDEKTPGVSAYAAYQGRWTGTVAGEDWEIAVSTAYGRDLLRVQTPRGMAWHALPPRGTGGGKYPIESRYGGAVTLDMTVDGRMLVQAAGFPASTFERWGGTDYVRLALPFAAANALTNAAFGEDGGGIRFKRQLPGQDRAAACSGDNPDGIFIDLFDPLEPSFVRWPAGAEGVTPDAQHPFRVMAARQEGASGPIDLDLESVEPRSGVTLTVRIEGAGGPAITLRPSGAVYADCTGPALVD